MIKKRIESIHQMWLMDGSTTSNTYVLDCILKMNVKGRVLNNNFQGVYQMVRVCEWNCRIIEDELKWLRLILGCGSIDKKDYLDLFIEKWGRIPNSEFSDVKFHQLCPRTVEDVSVEDFLSGSITPNHRNIGDIIRFWPKIERLVLEKAGGPMNCSSGYRQALASNLSSVVIDQIIDESHIKSSLQKRIGERCLENISAVQALLRTLYVEISNRLGVRGTQPPNEPIAALKRLNDTLYELRAVYIKIERAAEQSEWRTLAEWISLYGNRYGRWITMTREEFVQGKVLIPLWEDEETR